MGARTSPSQTQTQTGGTQPLLLSDTFSVSRDSRTVFLLDTTSNDNGRLRVYTELDAGLNIGDTVYVIGGGLDRFHSFERASSLSALYSGNLWAGYKVHAFDRVINAVTLDVPYNAAVTIRVDGLTGNTGRAVLCKNAFLNGDFRKGTWKEGSFGQQNKPKGRATFGVSAGQQTAAVTLWANGIWQNGVMRSGYFYSRTDPFSRPTYKFELSGAVRVPVPVTANNGGLGYNVWMKGDWGTSALAAENATWNNGSFQGGNWYNGAFYKGEMASVVERAIWTDGTWSAGTAVNVVWRAGTWRAGTWDAAGLPIDSAAFEDGQLVVSLPQEVAATFFTEPNEWLYVNGLKDAAGRAVVSQALLRRTVPQSQSTGESVAYVSLYFDWPRAAGAPVEVLDTRDATVGFAPFSTGQWNGGTFKGGVFGNLYPDPLGKWNTGLYWQGGTMTGSTFNGGLWINGMLADSPARGKSRWADGMWLNGTMRSAAFEAGVWLSGSAIASSIAPNALWLGGRSNNVDASPGIDWKDVLVRRGLWTDHAAPPYTFDFPLANQNRQTTSLITTSYTGATLAIVLQTDGVLRLPLFRTPLPGGGFLRAEAGRVFEFRVEAQDLVRPNIWRPSYFYKRLTVADATKINNANDNLALSGTATIDIPFAFLPTRAPASPVRVIVSAYRPPAPPAGYVADYDLQLVLKRVTPAAFYAGTGQLVPGVTGVGASTYVLAVKADVRAGGLATEANALEVLLLEYGGNQESGAAFPNPAGTSPQALPSSSVYFDMRDGFDTAIHVNINNGASFTARLTLQVRPYPGYTYTKLLTGTWRTGLDEAQYSSGGAV